MNNQNNSVQSEICSEVINNYNTSNPIDPQPIFKKICYNNITNLLIPNKNPNYSIVNTITDPNILKLLSLKNTNASVFSEMSKNPNGFNPTDIQQTNTAFNTILQETPIKIACCNRKQTQPLDAGPYYPLVRVAANNNFGFNLQTISVPKNSCPANLYADSPMCNTFYDVYCENVLNVFNKSNLPQEQFLNYAPECACYVPKTIGQSIYPDSTPPACYKKDCNLNTGAYLDTLSRNTSCNLTVCQNIVNAENIKAGGKVSINPTTQNNCGEFIPQSNQVTIKNITSGNLSSDSNKINNDSSIFNTTNIIIFIVVIILLCCCSCYFK
jgi:hypothetical protein